MRFLFLPFLLLLSCGEIIPCKTDELIVRQNYLGNLRLDGVYVADTGGTSCGTPDCGDFFFLYNNGFCLKGGGLSQQDKDSMNNIVFGQLVGGSVQRDVAVFHQNGTHLDIQGWGPSLRPCFQKIAYQGTVTSDSTFNISFWSWNGRDHQVNWIFRLYPGIQKPDSTNDFIR